MDEALNYSNGTKGGRSPYDLAYDPAYDPIAMFKVLILAAQNNVSDERLEFLIRDLIRDWRAAVFGL